MTSEKLDKTRFNKYFTNLGIRVDAVLAKMPTSIYVGQFPLQNKSGQLTDFAADVFYEPNPRIDLGHSHYFSIYSTVGGVFITGANHVENLMLTVYETDNDYIYARYQHDYRNFGQNSIDGGWWANVSDSSNMKAMCGRFLGDFGSVTKFSAQVKDGEFYRTSCHMS